MNGWKGLIIKWIILGEVSSGQVVYADGFKGYGKIVIIDHGNNLFTVSAYCSKLLAKKGDFVSRGETIAQLKKATGEETRFYFEIRLRGRPQDPLEWISKEEKRRDNL
jgi:septal ring factor EnvC (AmiA/AmiB activator)